MTIQHVVDKPSRAALFLVLEIKDGGEQATRDMLTGFAGLFKSVNFRYNEGELYTVVGIGASMWPRLTSAPMPERLKEFGAIDAAHKAPATPGDILLHFRANTYDLCHEMARQVLDQLGDAARVIDETHGFKYLDQRDLLGFVDGTANPLAEEALDTVLLGDDADYPRGSYVTVQKYIHDLAKWNELSTKEQEKVIGRTKVDDIELDDDTKPTNSHVALNDLEEDIYRETWSSALSPRVRWALTSSAMPRTQKTSWSACAICSLASRRETTTASWTSPPRLQAPISLCPARI